jgi:peptidoglycan/LPS O-acetylase OafA/YrhL
LWTYCSNFGMALGGVHFGPFAHFWTLAVEEQFYLIWPFIVRISPPNRLPWVCWGCVFVAVSLRLALTAVHQPLAAYWLMPARLDEFALGGLCATAVRNISSVEHKRHLDRTFAAGLVASVLGLAGLFAFGGMTTQRLAAPLRYSVVAAAAALLIWFAATRGPLSLAVRLLNLRPLRGLGKYSYGIYVIHLPLLPVLYVIEKRLLRLLPWSPRSELAELLVFDVFGMACVVLIAILSWHLFEKRFLKLKTHFDYVGSGGAEGGVPDRP